MRALLCVLLCGCGGAAAVADGGGIDGAVVDGVDAASTIDAAVATDAASIDLAQRDASFALSALPGLALWLDAGKGITLHDGNYVRYWADQSNNHNDGTSGEPHPVEEPSVVASSINGLPTLHFTPGAYTTPDCDNENCGAGTNIMINDSPSLQWGTGDFLIEVVGKYTNADPHSQQYSYSGTFFFRSSPNGPSLRGNTYPTPQSTSLSAVMNDKFGGTSNELASTKTGYNDGKPRLMAMQRVGDVITIRVNGVVTDSETLPSALDVNGTPGSVLVTIGASYSDEYRLDGDIAEVVCVKGAMTSDDVRGVEGFLMSKYAL